LNHSICFDNIKRTKNSFDIVAKNGNNVTAMLNFVEAKFDFVEKLFNL